MKTSEILKAAKERLAYGNELNTRGKNKLICNAIENVNSLDSFEIRKEIHKRLDGSFTVEAWLYREGYISDVTDCSTIMKIQEYRHAWVDALIAEYEAKGD